MGRDGEICILSEERRTQRYLEARGSQKAECSPKSTLLSSTGASLAVFLAALALNGWDWVQCD
jgi:hypothetical protein